MKNMLLILLLVVATTSYAQETTTFILIRHAEKVDDGTKDPPLHFEGEDSAEVLSLLFENADIDAIYSTDFKRTRMTVEPLAKIKGLEIQIYKWKNPKALLNKILEANNGGTIIICGHSNTTPILANLLTGKATYTTFEEDDYGKLFIITTTKIGAGKLLQMRY